MSDFNFGEGPKKILVDSFYAQVVGGLFNLMLQSGKEQQVFVLDAVLAKKLAKFFQQKVEAIEKQIGQSLDDRLDNEPLPSPFGNPGGEGPNQRL